MTERVYVHVGAPKSGTTFVQAVLAHNRARLADAGVLIAGETHLDRIHAAMVIREDPRLDALPERARQAWDRVRRQISGWRGESAILSYELLAGATPTQAAAALAALGQVEVHVVVTARDLARSIPSAWQERLKFALTTPLEHWRPRPDSAKRAEWGWRTLDPAGVAARWGRSLPPERVHIVTVPRSGDPVVLWDRFAEACDLDLLGLDTDVDRSNQSLGLVAAELLRRVNDEIGEPITGNREQAVWLRDTLAHGILADLDREPIGITDSQFTEATRRAQRAVRRIGEAGYRVHGELSDIEASRPRARTPGQARDGELLDAAVATIVRLLLLVRERTQQRDRLQTGREQSHGRAAEFGKGLVRRLTAPHVDRRTEELRARIAELEAQVAEARRLHLRVAELTDIVTELLLPAAKADKRLTQKAIAAYRQEAL